MQDRGKHKLSHEDIKRINGIVEILEQSLCKFKDHIKRAVIHKLCQRFTPNELKANYSQKKQKMPNQAKSNPKPDVPKDKILRIVEYRERKVEEKVKTINPNAKPDKDNSYILSFESNQHIKAHSRLAIAEGGANGQLHIINVNMQPKGQELPPLYKMQDDYYELGWVIGYTEYGWHNLDVTYPVLLIDGRHVENIELEIRLTGRKQALAKEYYKYVYNDLIKTNIWARQQLFQRITMFGDRELTCVIFSRKHIDMLDIDIKNIKRNCYQCKRYEPIETFRGQGGEIDHSGDVDNMV